MRLVSLGSGSKGNCTLVMSDTTCVLLDAGFGVKDTRERLAQMGVPHERIAAVVITHEHGDHAQGAGRLARAWGMPLYASQGTALEAGIDVVPVADGEAFQIGDQTWQPALVPHDAREPLQFVIEANDWRVGVCTDLGSLSSRVKAHFQNLDALLLECNYDPVMLQNGPYPPKLKARVGGDYGHLSNQQAAELFEAVCSPRLKSVVACHLSEKNNHPDRVREVLAPRVPEWVGFQIATQKAGCDWIDLKELAHGKTQRAV